MTKAKRFVPGLIFASVLALGSFSPISPAQAVNYDDYDYDGDANWNEEEWQDYSYNVIDYNNDGFIDQQEWDNYASIWYAPFHRINNYRLSYYDTNGDNLIDKSEYALAYDPNLFYSWDLDDNGYLDDEEYYTAYNTYDGYDIGGLYTW